jgi:hypothetical protein
VVARPVDRRVIVINHPCDGDEILVGLHDCGDCVVLGASPLVFYVLLIAQLLRVSYVYGL